MTGPSSRAARLTVAGLLALVALLQTRPAVAWRQYHTSKGKPMHWTAADRAEPVPYAVDQSGLPGDGISAATLQARVGAALGLWEAVACPICPPEAPQGDCGAQSCGERGLGLRFASMGLQAVGPIGLACVREEGGSCAKYAPNGNHVICAHEPGDWPFGAAVLAMTLLTAEPATGRLVDVDLTLNDAQYTFCDQDCAKGQWPLAPVLAHEAGHFLGLDHSLHPESMMRPFPLDAGGLAALHADDRAGACAVYPAPEATALCDEGAEGPAGDGGGCTAGRPAPSPASLLPILGVFCLLLGFRRPREGLALCQGPGVRRSPV